MPSILSIVDQTMNIRRQKLNTALITTILLLGILLSVESTMAQTLPTNHLGYFVLPPSHSENTSKSEPLMSFTVSDSETVDTLTSEGIRSENENTVFHLKTSTKFTLGSVPVLEWGSLHAQGKSTGQLSLNGLLITYHEESEFLAFVSGDQTETIVKMISGPAMTVRQQKLSQTTLLQPETATHILSTGELLAPYPYPIEFLNKWWTSPVYSLPYTQLPIANALEDQIMPPNSLVQLDGSRSKNYSKGDTFEWAIESGQKVVFKSEDIVRPSFIPNEEGEYILSLQITNQKGQKSNMNTVTVRVGYSSLKPEVSFSDVPLDHPYNIPISYLKKKGAITGVKDGSSGQTVYNPDQQVNRVSFLKILYENRKLLLSEEEKPQLTQLPFTDMEKGAWYESYVTRAYQEGVLQGAGGLLLPSKPVTLAEAVAMLLRASGYSTAAYESESQKPWFTPIMAFAVHYHLVESDADPSHQLTRGEVANLIFLFDQVKLNSFTAMMEGRVVLSGTEEGVPKSKIYFYEAKKDVTRSPFWRRGVLMDTATADENGAFSISLPRDRKYYVIGITPQSKTTTAVITEPRSITLETE